MKVDKIICTPKFKKSIQKLIKGNKKYKDEMAETVHKLEHGLYDTKNARKHHELIKGYSGYEDIHFSKSNNNLILIYKIRNDGSIMLLEIQDVVTHKELNRGSASDRFIDYDKKDIFGESYQHLKENIMANWKYTLDYGEDLKEAIDNEDYMQVLELLKVCFMEINSRFPDEYDSDELQDDLEEIENMQDNVANYEEYDMDWEEVGDSIDYYLSDFYDLCDALRIWVAN